MNELLYLQIGFILASIPFLAGVYLMGDWASHWVNDERYKQPEWAKSLSIIDDSEEPTIVMFLLVFPTIVVLVWPLAIIAGILFTVRALKRTKRKLNDYKQSLDEHINNTDIHVKRS